MSSSLLSPPPSPPDDLGSEPPGGSPPPPRPRRGRTEATAPSRCSSSSPRSWAGAPAPACVLLTGAGDNTTTTTTVTQATSAASERTSTDGRPQRAHALRRHRRGRRRHHLARDHVVLGGGGSPFGGPSQSATATGTGFVVDGKGHIVTAAHVVDGASSITVKFQDGTTRTAKVLGTDKATDVAVLSVDPSGLTLHPLALGSSASLAIGDQVAAIGDPFTYRAQPEHGRRLRPGPDDQRAQRLHRRARDPDRRGAQPRQLRRPGARRERQGHRHRRSDRHQRLVADELRRRLRRPDRPRRGPSCSQLEAGKTVRHAYLGVSHVDRGQLVTPARSSRA